MAMKRSPGPINRLSNREARPALEIDFPEATEPSFSNAIGGPNGGLVPALRCKPHANVTSAPLLGAASPK